MATSAKELYAESVRTLPRTEQLRLAALILEDLARPENLPTVVSADSWSPEDQRDVTSFSLQYAASVYDTDEELVG